MTNEGSRLGTGMGTRCSVEPHPKRDGPGPAFRDIQLHHCDHSEWRNHHLLGPTPPTRLSMILATGDITISGSIVVDGQPGNNAGFGGLGEPGGFGIL